MNINDNTKIYGIPDGIYYGQNERVDELNDRIFARGFPDIPLAPNFDPRPIPTKYSLFPIVNRRTPANVNITNYINHNVELNFNPGTQRAPPNGFFDNVDVETTLRNQNTAMQHGAYQGVFIPSSNSDLYKNSVVSRPSLQPYPELFSNYQYQTFISNKLENSNIGKDLFHNNTRTQLRTLS
jgi:hypothetical protein